MREYAIVMEGVAATVLLGLAGWLAWTAWRAPDGPFRSVSAGGAALCVLLAETSVHDLLILIQAGRVGTPGLRGVLVGPWAAVTGTVAVLIGFWVVFLTLRYWPRLGRAQSMVDVLTDQVPSAAHARQANLSEREEQVLDLIRAGVLSDEDIATSLHISRATAATHVQNILKKTGLHNRRDAMLLGEARGRRPR